MNHLFLIGNGFDIAHGLKTRYSDFIVWYFNKVFSEMGRKPDYQDSLIKIHQKSTPVAGWKVNSISDLKDIFTSSYISINYQFSFFQKLISTGEKNNWVDIEIEYYHALIKIFQEYEKRNILRVEEFNKSLWSLNVGFDFIKIELEKYLSIIDSSKKTTNQEINIHFNNILSKLGSEERILFLNFNYTSTLESYLEGAFKKACEINYVHGKLNDDNNPIIFGYGDEMDSYYHKIEQLNSNDFLKNFKSFGYFKTDNYRRFSRFIEGDSFRVHIMGHSCGLSDRILLNSIFEHPHCSSIRIYFHKKSESEDDFFEKTQEISRHFKPTAKGKMRNLIIPHSKSIPLSTR